MAAISLVALATLTGSLALDAPPAPTAAAANGCGDDHAPSLETALAASPILDGVGLPVIAASHPSIDPCPGIRPGGALVLRFGIPVLTDWIYCSMAFILTDGEALYVSTAGHCVDESFGVPTVGDRVSALGVPGTFGTVVYQWCEGEAANGGCGAGTDFAIIQIDPEKESFVSAAMCHWGAPTGGVFDERDAQLRTVQHFGWGIGIGDPAGSVGVPTGNPATQAREGLGLDFSDGLNFALVETAAISGDSGSGVLVGPLDLEPWMPMTAPKALGVLTHISVGGLAFVQRLDVSLARAFDDTGVQYDLVSV